MTLRHRPVATSDLPQICRFPQSAEELFYLFPKAAYPLTCEQLQQAIQQRADATVVEQNGKVVAFANFYRWDHGGNCAIGNMIVDPQARRSGVGRYLIKQMVALAFRKYQASSVSVSCFNHNVAGLLFYPSLGFTPYAIESRAGPAGQQLALIHLHLPRQPD
jgi:ribosomal protein S18 acetylase RimI-like enzyme